MKSMGHIWMDHFRVRPIWHSRERIAPWSKRGWSRAFQSPSSTAPRIMPFLAGLVALDILRCDLSSWLGCISISIYLSIYLSSRWYPQNSREKKSRLAAAKVANPLASIARGEAKHLGRSRELVERIWICWGRTVLGQLCIHHIGSTYASIVAVFVPRRSA